MALCLEASKRISAEESGPKLYLLLRRNLVLGFADAGLAERAVELLPEVQQLARKTDDRLELLRLDWTEGMIYERLGDLDRAAELFASVRDGFLQVGIGYDAALVSLDLASLYLKHGRHTEARELAEEMLPIFVSQDVHREAAAALAILTDALRREAASVALLRDVADYLSRSRHHASALFHAPS